MIRSQASFLTVIVGFAGIAAAVTGIAAMARIEPGPASPTTRTQSGEMEAAFDRLKTLAGTWDEEEYGRVVGYHLTGTALP